MTWHHLNRKIVRCDRCPRLREHCRSIAAEKRRAFRTWKYWGKPVPNFGDPRAELLIVGLAPAAHGANRTGRMFTGDRSGDWLYRALHRAGFANQPRAEGPADGLRLAGCAITSTCHCAPPDNKPTRQEIENCRPWLRETMDHVPARVFLALGHIGWVALLQEARRRRWLTPPTPKFGHGATVPLDGGRWLVGSYHPSQQNTCTGRLTEAMLDAVFATVRRLLQEQGSRNEI